MPDESISIVDFGSQYTQLIARRVRELNVHSVIYSCDDSADEIISENTTGLIFTGGPASVYSSDAPSCDPELLDANIPILGICYGMQMICKLLGAEVEATETEEYGPVLLEINETPPLFQDVSNQFQAWMSHADLVTDLPPEFHRLAFTDDTEFAAVKHDQKPFWGVQFHPEVTHTEHGTRILNNFLRQICRCEANWTPKNWIQSTVSDIEEAVQDRNVICGLSGGVDSSVTAALVHRAIGDQLTCIFVDNGLLRKNEKEDVLNSFKQKLDLDVLSIDAGERFLTKLSGVTDPEEKRSIIGTEFIEVFTAEARKIDNTDYLAQGTLYSDVIESTSAHGGPTARIKSHHNVGGLPEKLELDLIEPLRSLFKDEVREIGKELGVPSSIVERQPFPGPGLAIRITGEITPERLNILKEADKIVRETVNETDHWKDLWQYFAVLIPVQTVGVQGDQRTYEHLIGIRAVKSEDGMTANWARLPHQLLETLSTRILNNVSGVNRVVYDISPKPPSTIEWE